VIEKGMQAMADGMREAMKGIGQTSRGPGATAIPTAGGGRRKRPPTPIWRSSGQSR